MANIHKPTNKENHFHDKRYQRKGILHFTKSKCTLINEKNIHTKGSPAPENLYSLSLLLAKKIHSDILGSSCN